MPSHLDPFDPGDFYDPFEPPGWFIRNQRATLAEIVGRRLLAQAHAPLSPRARERHAAALAAGLARLDAAYHAAQAGAEPAWLTETVHRRLSLAMRTEHKEG